MLSLLTKSKQSHTCACVIHINIWLFGLAVPISIVALIGQAQIIICLNFKSTKMKFRKHSHEAWDFRESVSLW